MAKVLLENVIKKYGDVTALRDIYLDVRENEFLVLVGPSGCGKSTALRIIAGLEDITEGKVYIGERLVNGVAPKDRNVSMVFQNYALYPSMNVYDNLSYGLRIRKYPKAEIKKKVYDAANLLGIQNLLNRRPAELSGGERQRVAVGRAIVRDPEVFLFDEPLSNLDAVLRVHMRKEIKKLSRKISTTMIYVTHDQIEAMTMGDRIVVMKNGMIQQFGTPLEVYNFPSNMFVAGFIGSPAMNFLPCALERSGNKLYAKGEGFNLAIPHSKSSAMNSKHDGRKAILGIRPENIYPEPSKALNYTMLNYEILRASIDFVEPLGADILLNVCVGESLIVARASNSLQGSQNEMIDIVLDVDKIHLFDSATGTSLF